jgi:hypothetical protein
VCNFDQIEIRFNGRIGSETTQIWGRSSQAACDPWGVGTPLFFLFLSHFGELLPSIASGQVHPRLLFSFLQESHPRNVPSSAVTRPSLNLRIDRESFAKEFPVCVRVPLKQANSAPDAVGCFRAKFGFPYASYCRFAYRPLPPNGSAVERTRI